MITLNWWALAPALIPAAGLILVLVLDALLPGRRRLPLAVGVLALLGAAASAVPGAIGSADTPARTLCLPASSGTGATGGECFWQAGPLSSTLQLGLLLATLAALLMMRDIRGPAAPEATSRGSESAIDVTLLLGSAAGGVAVGAAHDLGTWLVALELATLPVIALVARRGTRRAGHGSLSLLVTSLLSFALLVVGVALWLVATGDPTWSGAAVATAWADPARRAVLLVAVLALLAGIGFKLSAVPFHAWTPPAFAGAPLPVTALLAAASKIAAVAALVAMLTPFVGLAASGTHPHVLAFALGALAVASMLVGTVVALRAGDIVRLLAWSTIAQGGWVLLPLIGISTAGLRACAGYVMTYAAASLLAFAALSAVRRTASGEPGAVRELAAYRGLARTDPHVGGPLLLAMVTFAGLPPGILGLATKVVALASVIGAGLWPLAVVAVIAVVLGIAAYLRVVAVLLADPEPARAGRVVLAGGGTLWVLAAGTALLVVAGFVPQVLYGLT